MNNTNDFLNKSFVGREQLIELIKDFYNNNSIDSSKIEDHEKTQSLISNTNSSPGDLFLKNIIQRYTNLKYIKNPYKKIASFKKIFELLLTNYDNLNKDYKQSQLLIQKYISQNPTLSQIVQENSHLKTENGNLLNIHMKYKEESENKILTLSEEVHNKELILKKQADEIQYLKQTNESLIKSNQEKDSIITILKSDLSKCQEEKNNLLSITNPNKLGFHSADSSHCVSIPLYTNKIDSLNTSISNENDLEQKNIISSNSKRIKHFDKEKYYTLSPFIQKNVKKLTHWLENKKYNLYDRKKNKNHLKRFIDILLTSSECEKILKVSKPIARKILRVFQDIFKDCFNIFIKSNGSKGRGHSLTIQLSFKNNSY